MENIDVKILEYIRDMPKWKVTTYKNIWKLFWVHPRKVARVMSQNKQPDIYPCYKVVSASGKLGWYSAFEGVSTKIKRLKKDWIEINNGKINSKYII